MADLGKSKVPCIRQFGQGHNTNTTAAGQVRFASPTPSRRHCAAPVWPIKRPRAAALPPPRRCTPPAPGGYKGACLGQVVLCALLALCAGREQGADWQYHSAQQHHVVRLLPLGSMNPVSVSVRTSCASGTLSRIPTWCLRAGWSTSLCFPKCRECDDHDSYIIRLL
jgi:hypothetical protein